MVGVIRRLAFWVKTGAWVPREAEVTRPARRPLKVTIAPGALTEEAPGVGVMTPVRARALAPPEGWPKSMSKEGLGYGTATKRDDDSYKLVWTGEQLWLADKDRDMQFYRYGKKEDLTVETDAKTYAEAKGWLEAMARQTAGTTVRWTTRKQARVVDPPPPRRVDVSKRLYFKCTNAPKMFPVPRPSKNAACMRGRKRRTPFKVVTKALGNDWYVAGWRYGPLAAGRDMTAVHETGVAVLDGLNLHGRPRALV